MNTSYGRKLADLTSALIRHPPLWWPYLKHLPAWGRQPVDLELPWFSYGAIAHLDTFLQGHHRIFEFGSGGSSFYFARKTAGVTAVESHPEWHERVVSLGQARGLANLSCELHPLGDGQLEGYRQSSFFSRVLAGRWDVIVIDCFCGFSDGSYGQLRRHAFELALDCVAPGGLIVLDDSWLFPELLRPRSGWEIRDFRGPGPCRYGVTSTAVFTRAFS